MKIRPMLTKNAAQSLAALMDALPASIATQPDNLRAVEYIRDLAAWRLSTETQERRDRLNARSNACKAGKSI